jgi:hypothetical protein
MRLATRKLLAYAGAATVLAAVALMYMSPHLMVDLAARVWACF